MFIVNDKSNCCNNTFTDVRLASLLPKNIEEEYKLFMAARISISLAIMSKIVIKIGYFFYELCKKTKVGGLLNAV